MVEFSVRIDFYRDLEGPKGYVGSALRDGVAGPVRNQEAPASQPQLA
jgi:hypothetical protein